MMVKLPRHKVGKWREFLGLDKRSLALFRICLGGILCLDTLGRIHDAYHHYSDAGVFPREAVLSAHWNYYWLSIHMISGSTFVMQVLFFIHAIFAFLMMIGYRTKLTTFVSWFLLCSQQARNNVVGHGGDAYMRVIMFWAMFLPTACCFSVDNSFRKTRRTAKQKQPLAVCGGGIAMILQVTIVYVFSYLHKWGDEWHVYGTSTHYALLLDYFRLPMANFFLHFPTLMKYLSFAVLYYELWGSALFYAPIYTGPLRTLGAVLFIVMHVGFGSCMGLGIFSPISSTALMTLIAPWFWDELIFPWLYSGAERDVRILYYKNTPGEKLAIAVSDFLLLPETSTVTSSDSQLVNEQFGWMAVERNGTLHTGFKAFEQICQISPLLRPMRFFLKIQPVHAVIRAISVRLMWIIAFAYDQLKSPQSSLPLFEASTPAQAETNRTIKKIKKLVMNGIPLCSIVVIFMWNCGNMQYYSMKPPDSVYPYIFTTRIDQMWNMFSPGPPRMNWWYTVEGVTDGGKRIEIWREGLQKWAPVEAPYSVEKPENLGLTVGNHRWVKYYEYLNWGGGNSAETVRLHFGRYICREYNKRHHGKDRFWKFNLIFHSEENHLDRPPTRLDDVNYWSHVCYDKRE